MAAYDSPGFVAPLPGGVEVSHDSAMTAPGSPGADPAAVGGAPLATVPVRDQWASSQVPAPMVTVTTGDTASSSDDAAVRPGPLLPVDPAAAGRTGAGRGTVCGPDHPNASTPVLGTVRPRRGR